MSDDDSSDDSTAHNPTAKPYIVYHLAKFGPSTVHEMATKIGYSHKHIRMSAKALLEAGVIEGERTTGVLSCRINGMWIILDSNRAKIVRQLHQCASHLASRAQGMTLNEVHNLVQNNAERTGILAMKWLFWYPDQQGDDSPSPAAPADD